MDNVSLTGLLLLLDVSGVRVMDAVREVVVSRGIRVLHMVGLDQQRGVVNGVHAMHWDSECVGGGDKGEQGDELRVGGKRVGDSF